MGDSPRIDSNSEISQVESKSNEKSRLIQKTDSDSSQHSHGVWDVTRTTLHDPKLRSTSVDLKTLATHRALVKGRSQHEVSLLNMWEADVKKWANSITMIDEKHRCKNADCQDCRWPRAMKPRLNCLWGRLRCSVMHEKYLAHTRVLHYWTGVTVFLLITLSYLLFCVLAYAVLRQDKTTFIEYKSANYDNALTLVIVCGVFDIVLLALLFWVRAAHFKHLTDTRAPGRAVRHACGGCIQFSPNSKTARTYTRWLDRMNKIENFLWVHYRQIIVVGLVPVFLSTSAVTLLVSSTTFESKTDFVLYALDSSNCNPTGMGREFENFGGVGQGGRKFVDFLHEFLIESNFHETLLIHIIIKMMSIVSSMVGHMGFRVALAIEFSAFVCIFLVMVFSFATRSPLHLHRTNESHTELQRTCVAATGNDAFFYPYCGALGNGDISSWRAHARLIFETLLINSGGVRLADWVWMLSFVLSSVPLLITVTLVERANQVYFLSIYTTAEDNLRFQRPQIVPKCLHIDRRYKIGTGGAGQVFKGRYAGFRVAVKEMFSGMIKGNLRESFKEAEILARMRHPNILTFYGIHASHRSFLIVTDLCACNLKSIITDEHTVLNGIRMHAILLQVAQGLDYLHTSNLEHYDVKPENILLRHELEHKDMLGKKIVVKIADFGLSRVVPVDASIATPKTKSNLLSPRNSHMERMQKQSTSANHWFCCGDKNAIKTTVEKQHRWSKPHLGTYEYMPPEVIRAEKLRSDSMSSDPVLNAISDENAEEEKDIVYQQQPYKWDVYSFGVVCWQVHTRKNPFSSWVEEYQHKVDTQDVKRMHSIFERQLASRVPPAIMESDQWPIDLIGEMSENVVEGMKKIISMCLHPNPKRRPLLVDVAPLIQELAGESMAAEKEIQKRRKARKKRRKSKNKKHSRNSVLPVEQPEVLYTRPKVENKRMIQRQSYSDPAPRSNRPGSLRTQLFDKKRPPPVKKISRPPTIPEESGPVSRVTRKL